ncbi:MAG: dethiobiotin synthase [Thermodesulfobacteriota bacterium]
MSNFPKGIFVTGTDTGVGKTVVSAIIAWSLQQSGKRVAVMKPVQTGAGEDGLLDIEFIQKVMGTNYSLDVVCPYRFSLPLAPQVAAKLAGQRIDVDKIKSAYFDLSSWSDIVIVEGSGGLLVPITETYFMSDLAYDLEVGLIIVIRPGLGTMNHTLLTLEHARLRGLNILGFVINNFPDTPTLAERKNPELLLKLTEEKILGVIHHDQGISVERGDIGNLIEMSGTTLSDDLGGTFLVEDFISRL